MSAPKLLRGQAAEAREELLMLTLPDKVDELETLATRAADHVMANHTRFGLAVNLKQEMRHAVDLATEAYLMACELEALTKHDESDDETEQAGEATS